MHILGLHRIDFLNSLFLVMGKNIPWWRSRLSGISLETPAQWVSVLRLPQLNVSCYCCWCCSCDSWQQNFDTKCEICPSVTGKISSCSRVSFSELEDGECPGTRARDASTTVSLAAMPLLTMTNIFPNSALRISGPCLPVCLFEWANFTHLAVYL